MNGRPPGGWPTGTPSQSGSPEQDYPDSDYMALAESTLGRNAKLEAIVQLACEIQTTCETFNYDPEGV